MKDGICPYPGLRPFTEEESIFFKGRDTHIRQIAKLLEENKMAFITGASGDGKSSMVYAGVLPYIRAGFTKAKFNSWLVFDFKPQRNPLASLAESAAKEMDMPFDYMLREFRRGFSTLAHMYVNSEYYMEDGDDRLQESYGRLVDEGLIEEIEDLKLYWSKAEGSSKMGESSCLMRVAIMNPKLRGDDVPDDILDYCLLKQLANIKVGFALDRERRTEEISNIMEACPEAIKAQNWLEANSIEV